MNSHRALLLVFAVAILAPINAVADNDGDGIDDASDSDDDNDGVPDVADWAPMDSTEQYDTDGDGIGDNADTDDDNDGYQDAVDAFPLDASESADADWDGVGDNADPDDDNDGTPDGLDAFPNDATEQRDYDGDGIGDVADADRDEDGYLNSDDAFPMNQNEWMDTDGDNVGDNSDSDIDGDSVLNADDWAPTDAAEWDDTDGDGTGDNADTDDDGDGVLDTDEDSCGTDSKNAASVPSDFDGDGLCDMLDDEDNRGEPGNNPIANKPQETPAFELDSNIATMLLLATAILALLFSLSYLRQTGKGTLGSTMSIEPLEKDPVKIGVPGSRRDGGGRTPVVDDKHGHGVNQPVSPPIPDDGLPEGWTIEQWIYYGEEWIYFSELLKQGFDEQTAKEKTRLRFLEGQND